jgi:putative transposase
MTETLLRDDAFPVAASGFDVDLSPCDCRVGELYAVMVPDHNAALILEFRKRLSTGVLRFVKAGTDQEFHFHRAEWDDMRSDRRACRISVVKRGRSAAEIEDIDPLSLLDPEEPNIKVKERNKRLTAARKLARARMLRFYVIRYDEGPPRRGGVGLREFIEDLYEEARAAKHFVKPTKTQLIRAIDNCGTPGSRPLSAFLARNGLHNRSLRWPDFTLELGVAMNSAYWTIKTKRKCDVISDFYAAFDPEKERRAVELEELQKSREAQGLLRLEAAEYPSDLLPLTRPSRETLRLWICAGENYWSWNDKYGKDAARRRFIGRGRPIEPTEPLQYVMIDHTRCDAWAVLYDEGGHKILIERPWLTLAIDVYSRMILGAVLTYEGPSVYSAMMCLRQVVRNKKFLIEKYGYRKGATDGYGAPGTVIVDNAWEFVGVSFQVCLEACGINVIWAPVKSGEFKTYAERAFGYLNGMLWHRLDAGIPYKPQEMAARGLDPRPKAIQTKEWMYDRMWDGIVNIYHLEPHGEEKIIPALRWREGLLAADGRKTLDDVGEFDKVLGQSKRCLLTAEGIKLDGERFHDKAITTDLLNRLMSKAPKRNQRKGLSSGKIFVLGTPDPGDASFIHVWDWIRRKNIRLPNWRREYSVGLSWHAAKKIQEFVRQTNLAFHSDAERHAARSLYDKSLREQHPNLPFRQARKNAAELSKPRLIDGEYATLVKESVSETEKTTDIVNVPQTLPARERTDDRIPDPGIRRGGKAATKKSIRNRARNRARKAEDSRSKGELSRSSDPRPTESASKEAEFTEAESLRLLAELEKKLK